MPCAEWYTRVDSRRLSTVESKSKAVFAVDSGAWLVVFTAPCYRGAAYLCAFLCPLAMCVCALAAAVCCRARAGARTDGEREASPRG
eukprot:2496011-Pyramimonas_sp.AAC.1